MSADIRNSGHQGSLDMQSGRHPDAQPDMQEQRRDGAKVHLTARQSAAAAAFSLELGKARDIRKPEELAEEAQAVAPNAPVAAQVVSTAGDPAPRLAATQSLVEQIATELRGLEKAPVFKIGQGVEITLPQATTMPGVEQVKLSLSAAGLAVTLQLSAGAQAAAIAAAVQELTTTLAQRFPNRSIRVEKQERGRDAAVEGQFDPLNQPLNQPVRRRT